MGKGGRAVALVTGAWRGQCQWGAGYTHPVNILWTSLGVEGFLIPVFDFTPIAISGGLLLL